MKRPLLLCLCLSSLVVAPAVVRAQNLLMNGDLEVPAAEFASWTTQEFRTGAPETIDSLTRESFANHPSEIADQFGAWLRPWAAGDTSTQQVNAILSQTVPGSAGATYSLSGWSKFEDNYAGGVNFLHFTSPSDPDQTGTVPSPTNTYFELAFLDAGNAVIGTPTTVDLRVARAPTPNDLTWRQSSLAAMAPAGTAKVRVSASMLNGVFNRNPAQSAFVDDFSLTTTAAPTTELLANANLNTPPIQIPTSFTLTELPAGRDTAGGADFANRVTPGVNGLWLKAFSGSLGDASDAILSQTLSATPGGNYTFSAYSKWEANYSGGLAAISGQPSPTKTLLQIEFFDALSAPIGAPVTLNLKTAGQLNDSTWRQFSLNAVAPGSAASLRISAIMDDGVNSGANPQSAFFDDLSLTVTGVPTQDADFDNDGDVDGQDFLTWQRGFGTPGATNAVGDADGNGTVNGADLAIWKTKFSTNGSVGAAGAVPEPAGIALGSLAVAALLAAQRRRISA